MKFIYIIMIVVLMVLVFSVQCNGKKPKCYCPQYYDPICGTDSVTYMNPCEFSCHKRISIMNGKILSIRHAGPCDKKH